MEGITKKEITLEQITIGCLLFLGPIGYENIRMIAKKFWERLGSEYEIVYQESTIIKYFCEEDGKTVKLKDNLTLEKSVQDVLGASSDITIREYLEEKAGDIVLNFMHYLINRCCANCNNDCKDRPIVLGMYFDEDYQLITSACDGWANSNYDNFLGANDELSIRRVRSLFRSNIHPKKEEIA